jgi:hypothetical protein
MGVAKLATPKLNISFFFVRSEERRDPDKNKMEENVPETTVIEATAVSDI